MIGSEQETTIDTASGLVRRRWRCAKLCWIAVALLLLCLSLLMDVATGPASIPWSDLLSCIWAPESVSPGVSTIVWTMRLPMAMMACAVGVSLGMAGAEMQTILNNPLASPFTLGVSAAASFGASLAIVYGASSGAACVGILSTIAGSEIVESIQSNWMRGWTMVVPGAAFFFTLVSSLAIALVAKLKGGALETIVLCGVALLFFFNAGVAFLQFSASEDTLQAIVFWTFGSLQGATLPKVAIVSSVALLSFIVFVRNAWVLTAFRLGDAQAESLGISVKRVRLIVLTICSGLTATAVCFTGVIGFVGLVAPHLARMIIGEDQRFFLPLSAILGGILLSLASILSKTLMPGVILPIGIVTSMVGVPFFFSMVLMQRRRYW